MYIFISYISTADYVSFVAKYALKCYINTIKMNWPL